MARNLPAGSQCDTAINGRARTVTLANTGCLSGTTQIISSGERKAIETAEIIAGKLNVAVEVREAMHENDRSATGFLPPNEFEAVANQFFAKPIVSIKGWERAIDAQLRIVREVEHVLARNRAGDVLFVGHGALFYFVTMQVLRLIEPMIKPVGAVTVSRSSKTGVACCIHGVEWKTCREGVNFR